jgi:hypothetical protein
MFIHETYGWHKLVQLECPSPAMLETRSILDLGYFQTFEYFHTHNGGIMEMKPKSKHETHLCFIYTLYL